AGVGRIGGLDRDAAIETEDDRRHPDLAAEWRCRRGAQDHWGSSRVARRKSIRPSWPRRVQDRARLLVGLMLRGRRRCQPVMTRLTAFGPLPFLSGSTSKVMRWPSLSNFRPARSTAVM